MRHTQENSRSRKTRLHPKLHPESVKKSRKVGSGGGLTRRLKRDMPSIYGIYIEVEVEAANFESDAFNHSATLPLIQ